MTARTAERAQLAAWWAGARGPVWVVGAPGVGKSTLIAAVPRAPERRWRVELAGAADVSAVTARVARAVGLPQAGRADAEARIALLGRFFSVHASVDLVLDDPAPMPALAPVLGRWCEAAHDLRVVVAARWLPPAPATVLRLAPLSIEAAAALLKTTLEARGGQQISPEAARALAVVSGGLPLAVEVLAGLGPLRLRRLVGRAEMPGWVWAQAEPMQRAFETAWQHLAPGARRAAAVLAGVDGAVDLDDAAALLTAVGALADPWAALDTLHDQCWVRAPDGAALASAVHMPGPQRAFVCQRVPRVGGLVGWWAARAEAWVAARWARPRAEVDAWFGRARGTLRAAILDEATPTALRQRLVVAVYRLEAFADATDPAVDAVADAVLADQPGAWTLRLLRARRRLLVDADLAGAQADLAAVPACRAPLERALVAARVAVFGGAAAQAQAQCAEVIAAAPPLGLAVEAWTLLGIAHQWAGAWAEADAAWATAEGLARRVGQTYEGAVALALRGQIALLRGEVPRADALHAEARRFAGPRQLPFYPSLVALLVAVAAGRSAAAVAAGGLRVAEARAVGAMGPAALGEAVMALAHHAGGDDATAVAWLNQLRRTLRAHPPVGQAFAALPAAVAATLAGETEPAEHPNFFVRLVRQAGAWVRRPTLRLGPEDAWLQLDSGSRLDLRRRHPTRRVLVALAEVHPAGLSCEALIAAGWPGDTAFGSALRRLRVLVSGLRAAGFGGAIETVEGGYRLAPSLRVARRSG